MARPNVEVERRNQILKATSTVIAVKGIRALRISDVADETGVSPGIIHYYFDNKDALIKNAFERNFERSLERRSAILRSEAPAKDKLLDLIDAYLPGDEETIEAWHVWAELWVEGLHDPELQKLNEQAYGQWRQIVASILTQGQQEGSIKRDGDPTMLANLLASSLDGLALQVLVSSYELTLDAMREAGHKFVELVSV